MIEPAKLAELREALEEQRENLRKEIVEQGGKSDRIDLVLRQLEPLSNAPRVPFDPTRMPERVRAPGVERTRDRKHGLELRFAGSRSVDPVVERTPRPVETERVSRPFEGSLGIPVADPAPQHEVPEAEAG